MVLLSLLRAIYIAWNNNQRTSLSFPSLMMQCSIVFSAICLSVCYQANEKIMVGFS